MITGEKSVPMVFTEAWALVWTSAATSNLQLMYTGYLYSADYNYNDDEYEVNGADTLTLGGSPLLIACKLVVEDWLMTTFD